MVRPSIHNIKKGKKLPKNAIPLAKFSNNVNASNNNKTILSASSEKNTTQSKIGRKWITVNNATSINQNLFPKAQHYSDEYGFFGEITLTNIDWETRVRETKKEITIQKKYTVKSLSEIPKTIKYSDTNGSGTLCIDMDNDNIIKTTSTTSVIDYTKYKYIVKNFLTSQGSISFDDGNYSGKLECINRIDNLKPMGSTISVSEITVENSNGQFTPSVIRNGKTYYFTEKLKQRKIEVWRKHYGLCRYWGGGGTSSNNYYGDPDYRFNVDSWIAKGYMNAALPSPTQQRWGHWMDKMSNHANGKYPIDTGGYWDYEDGEYDGVKWTYDIEAAAVYGGSTDPAKGGVVWASQYWDYWRARIGDGEWPPPGYEVDAYNDSHIPRSGITGGSDGTINHTQINLCVKGTAQKTSAAGFYNAGGWYCKWFRDIILFYKGMTTGYVYDGIYSNATLLNKGYTKYSIYNYGGYVSKNFFKEIENVRSYAVTVNYSGIISKTVTTYDGLASYEGLVYKKIFINDIARTIIPSQVYIHDSDGYLATGPFDFNTEINSNNILMTNVSCDGEPLFYTAKIASQIRIPSLYVTKDILGPERIKLIYDKNIITDLKYVVKITNASQDKYYMEIVSNIPFGIINPCKAKFINTSNEFVEEDLYSELLLKNNIDYHYDGKSIYIEEARVAKPDDRIPVRVECTISTTDDSFVSNIIIANVFNKKYALFDELNKFHNDKYIISPATEDGYMTAIEIVAADNNLSVDDLDGYSFKVTNVITTDSANVYTDIDGNGLLYCSTKADTGYPVRKTAITNTGQYNKYLIQKSIMDEVYNGYYVEYLDQREIGLVNPVDNHELVNWYLKIAYSAFSLDTIKNDVNIRAEYDIPEYKNQPYSSSLRLPYIDCVETPTLISSNIIKVKNKNIYINTNNSREIQSDCITVFNKTLNKNLTVIGFDINGYIVVKEAILPQYELECSYSYAEENYIYKGYRVSDQVFVHLDINPSMYHTYVDPIALTEIQSYNLFNKTVYFFLKPYRITNNVTSEIIESNPNYTLYHKIDDSVPVGQFDILIGILVPAPISSMKNTTVNDIRQLGGGVKDKYLPFNEGVFDIPNSDGIPVPTNNTVVIKIKKALLPEGITSNEIEEVLKKHAPIGTVCIIEYV